MSHRPISHLLALFAGATAVCATAAPAHGADGSRLLRYQSRPAVASDAQSLGHRSAGSEAPDRGRSLAAADFDDDGIPDLAVGLGAGSDSLGADGRLRVHRGSPGEPSAYGAVLAQIDLPAPVDLLGAGDFDRDGHADLVAASREEPVLRWLPGRGDGGFADPIDVPLPGRPTALAAGALDVFDGLDDLAVAVTGPAGAELVVFRSIEPSFAGDPLRLPLPNAASALAIGDLVGGHGRDLAVAAGDSLVVVPGADRLIRGNLPPAGRPVVSALSFRAVALAVGDLLRRGEDRRDLAVLGAGGEIEIRRWPDGVSEKRPAGTVVEWSVLRVEGGAAPTSVPRRRSGTGAPPPALLLPVRQEATGGDGLAVVAGAGEIELLAFAASKRTPPGAKRGGTVQAAVRRRLAAPAVTAALPATLNGDALTDLVVLREDGALEVIASALGTVFVVDSTGSGYDDDTGDGVCRTDAGTCTLWAAVQEAEALDGADTIRFAINPSAPPLLPRIITYPTNIRTLDGPLTIEGPNQGGAPIVLDGGQLSATSSISAFAFDTESSNIVLRNLTIKDFAQSALRVWGSNHTFEGLRLTGNGWANGTQRIVSLGGGGHRFGGSAAAARNVVVRSPGAIGITVASTAGSGIQILGNFVGVDTGGTPDPDPLGTGIWLERGAQVGSPSGGGNVVVAGDGIVVVRGDGARLWGNRVGTTPDGLQPLGDGRFGLVVRSGDGHLIGGAGIGLGNVVAGQSSMGIRVWDQYDDGDPTNLALYGNLVGTDALGASALPNGTGILIREAVGVSIGGPSSGRNVVSGNTGTAVALEDVVDATIRGNHLGVGADGVTPLPNFKGIDSSGGEGLFIGGHLAGEGNIISANDDHGIEIDGIYSEDVVIVGNRIGVAADASPLGNQGDGIRFDWMQGARVGTPQLGNEIAYNGGNGVALGSSDRVELQRNSIHGNGGLAIDLGLDGVTLNDPGDGDAGDNERQNFPVLDGVFTDGSETRIRGWLDSVPDASHRVEIFTNTVCDPSGHGEARTFLAETTATTDGSGRVELSLTLPHSLPPGTPLTATATSTMRGETSELSRCRDVRHCTAGADDVTLTQETASGVETVEACRSITARDDYRVSGDVTFRAGRRIVLGDGFSVAPGGSFRAVVEVP